MRESGKGNIDIRLNPLQLISLIVLIQLVVIFFTTDMILSFDEAMWQYIGRNWLRNGLVPYAGGIDNKSPLIFLIFGISDRLFGVNFWFPRLLGIAVQSAGIFLLYRIAEKRISPRAGLFAISLYGLALAWRTTGGKYVSYTETYAITFILAAIYFSISLRSDRYSFFGGLLAGFGLGFRFSAAFGILPLFIYHFNKSRKTGIIFLLGIVTATGFLLFLGLLAGIRPNDYLFYGFTDNFGSGSPTSHSLAWEAQKFADGFFYSELILFYPAVLAYFFIVRKMDFLKGWLMSEFIGIVILGIYARNHFKELLPVLSLMAAFVIDRLIENYHIPPRQLMLGIWILFFPKTFEPLFAIKKLFLPRNPSSVNNKPFADEDENKKKDIGLWIRNNTNSKEKLFVAGYGAQIQAYSERQSPSVYFNATQTLFAKKKLFADLMADKPELLVIPLSDKYAGSVGEDIRSYVQGLATNYYTLDTCLYNYNIYKYRASVIH
ncbi:MAG TPA: glycosyltransferase family 39 protein [Puia sp.]|nr:glycosyltransferase family 39 protein [Puia sp.]